MKRVLMTTSESTQTTQNGTSSALAIAVYLIMLHYGGGFLLGTGEKAATQGLAASLYPVSAALGLIAILFFVRVYLRERRQLADILGAKYGSIVRGSIGFLSWTWMVGVAASQIIGGRAVLRMLGIDLGNFSVFILGIVMIAISLSTQKWLKNFFTLLLILSTAAIVFALLRLNGVEAIITYLRAPIEFIPSLGSLEIGTLLAVPITTILLTSIGEDFQEYIIEAKSLRAAVYGCLIAAFILFWLAFLPTVTVLVAQTQSVLGSTINPREAIPYILSWSGGGKDTFAGVLLGVSLLIIVAGSGAGLLRALNSRTFSMQSMIRRKSTTENVPIVKNGAWNLKLPHAVFNMVFIVLIALTEKDIIDIIVQFYAVYVAAAFIPALSLVLTNTKLFAEVKRIAIQIGIMLGAVSSILILVMNLDTKRFTILNDVALTIITFGLLSSVVGLLTAQFFFRTPQSPIDVLDG